MCLCKCSDGGICVVYSNALVALVSKAAALADNVPVGPPRAVKGFERACSEVGPAQIGLWNAIQKIAVLRRVGPDLWVYG